MTEGIWLLERSVVDWPASGRPSVTQIKKSKAAEKSNARIVMELLQRDLVSSLIYDVEA